MAQTIKNKNNVNIVSFLKFTEKRSDTFSTGQITLSTKVDENGTEVTKYLNIQVASKIDLTEFNDKRVQIQGFFIGNMYKGKTSLRIWISSIKELPTGKGSNSLTFTTRTSFVREGEGEAKWTSAQGSLRFNAGSKEAENMQYVNIGIKGNKDTLKLKDGEIITVKGYLAPEFVPANGDRPEFTKPVIVALEVVERTGEGTSPKPSSSTSDTTAEQDKPKAEPKAEVTIDDEDIPF